MGLLSKLKKLSKELGQEIEQMIDALASHGCDSNRKVFAHYMVGLTYGQSSQQWAHDIKTAKEAGIDGFALNIGPSDHWTVAQLDLAYEVAEQAGEFVLFLSFDMAAGSWEVSQVVDFINRYRGSPAQMNVDGKPLVSTFEGPDWAENWPTVRSQTGDIFLVPDWSSLGPYGIGEKLDLIDGAFSWDAWPKAGQRKMGTAEDLLYLDNLKGKKYMMGVSPWFYTNLPQWNKNWHCSSESLWFDRWQQVLEIMPDFVQIITWNDFGESSYIGDTVPEQIVRGAEDYVVGYSHSAFRAVLPYFIRAYKMGSPYVGWAGEDIAIAWYRTSPARANCDCSTVWGQGGSLSASAGARDVISIIAITREPAHISVCIGDGYTKEFVTAGQCNAAYFEMPFDESTTGPVRLSLNGKITRGPAIQAEVRGEKVSFNAVAIQV